MVLNRAEKGLFRTLGPADAERVLRRPVAFSVCNDHDAMSQTIDRGIPLAEVKRKCSLGRDIDTMEQGVTAALRLEH